MLGNNLPGLHQCSVTLPCVRPWAQSCSGMDGTAVDKAQVALGQLLLGREKLYITTSLGLSLLAEKRNCIPLGLVPIS